mmetsp:Transcript_4526/g.11053  ORF Transcript_4526/g.11053 Transcript_4526/m.11053 type:complete len:93 (+) Transcript_4526:96-374(+)|eukprot:g14853.t1
MSGKGGKKGKRPDTPEDQIPLWKDLWFPKGNGKGKGRTKPMPPWTELSSEERKLWLAQRTPYHEERKFYASCLPRSLQGLNMLPPYRRKSGD